MRLLAVLCLVSVSCGVEGEPTYATQRSELTQVTGFGSNPGNLSLHLHVPSNLGANPALVVALHGCSQDANAYEKVGWNSLADAHGFLVAYAQTAGNTGCYDWFSVNQQSRTGPQVTSILQMVNHLVSTRGVDSSRVFVTGLSAGGAMTNVLLAVAPDVFTRGQVIAAVPFGCATSSLGGYSCMTTPPNRTPEQWGALVDAVRGSFAPPRVQLWHGTGDFTVSSGNLQEQVDQWTNVNGIDVMADETTTVGVATRRVFRDGAGVTRVESWSLANAGHGAPIDVSNGCGTSGLYMLNVGVCSAEDGARFFGLLEPPVVVDAGVIDVPLDAGVQMNAPDAGTPGEGTVPQGCSTASMVAPVLVLLWWRRRA